MTSAGDRPVAPAPGRLASGFANAVVALRWWVVAFWLLATTLSVLVLPALSEVKRGDNLRGLLPVDAPAVATEIRSVQTFGFPLLGRTVLVQRDPDGLSVYDQARTVANAVGVNTGRYQKMGPLLGALPITNTGGLFPASSERDTTALTYFFARPGIGFATQAQAARRYADRYFDARDDVVGVTGPVPARAQQGKLIGAALPLVELATLTAIVLIVGVNFRSIVAPVLTVATTAIAYVLTLRLSGYVSTLFNVPSPSELEPVVVALLLGVVTDYVVFFCAALRRQLMLGADRLDAARDATAQFAPIIGIAGLAVAAGTGAMLVAESTFFKALGPALMFTVLIALAVAITLVPALMALLGRLVFWPTQPPRHVAEPQPASPEPSGSPGRTSAVSRVAGSRRNASLVVAACVAILALAAVPLVRLDLGVSFVGSLPGDASVARSAAAAQSGFAPGILSPTVVLVEGDALGRQLGALSRLNRELESLDGVAGVLGPGDQPLGLELGILLAESGDAARYLVVLDDKPLGAAAINTVDQLKQQLPMLLRTSGLSEARAGLAGDTATATYIVELTEQDILRITVAAVLANLLMLVLFLRALVAPLFLLAATVLSVAATLGLTTWLFELVEPGAGLTFYVPFAAAVLLLAFGSDYNIFGVGHVWEEARRRPLADAIAIAVPQTTRAIMVAGLALATSFGLLAMVPLASFRQLAFAMCVGILIDVFIVRSLLMPALLTVLGPISAWPSKRLRVAPETPAATSPAPAPG